MHIATLQPEDKILIWASDGLWEFMSNQEVRLCRITKSFRPRIVASHLLRPFSQVIDKIAMYDDPKKCVDILVAEANARWMKEEQVVDDTTVIVAFLNV
jgi:serine/threonine protein phosphatase PrpC